MAARTGKDGAVTRPGRKAWLRTELPTPGLEAERAFKETFYGVNGERARRQLPRATREGTGSKVHAERCLAPVSSHPQQNGGRGVIWGMIDCACSHRTANCHIGLSLLWTWSRQCSRQVTARIGTDRVQKRYLLATCNAWLPRFSSILPHRTISHCNAQSC